MKKFKNIFTGEIIDFKDIRLYEGPGGTTVTEYQCCFCGTFNKSGTTNHPDICPDCRKLLQELPDIENAATQEKYLDVLYYLGQISKRLSQRLNEIVND